MSTHINLSEKVDKVSYRTFFVFLFSNTMKYILNFVRWIYIG